MQIEIDASLTSQIPQLQISATYAAFPGAFKIMCLMRHRNLTFFNHKQNIADACSFKSYKQISVLFKNLRSIFFIQLT